MARTIATFSGGPSRGALIGEQAGQAFQQAFQDTLGQRQQQRQLAELGSPMLEALQASQSPIAQGLAGSPAMVGQLMQSPQGLQVLQSMTQPAEPRQLRGDAGVIEDLFEGRARAEARGDQRRVSIYDARIDRELQEKGPEAVFGTGVTGKSLQYMTELAPAIEGGYATPQQRRIWDASLAHYTQPRITFDPITRQEVEVRPELPGFVQRALDAGAAQPTRRAEPRPGDEFEALPQDLQIPDLASDLAEFGVTGASTLYEMVLEGRTTGPGPAVMRVASQVPGLGIRADAERVAEKTITGLTRRIADSLRQNPRFVEGERAELVQDYMARPRVFDTDQAMASDLVGVDEILRQVETEMQAVVDGRIPLVTGETRGLAMDTLRNVQNMRSILVPPRFRAGRDIDAFEQWRQTARPGSMVLVQDERGNWQPYTYDPE